MAKLSKVLNMRRFLTRDDKSVLVVRARYVDDLRLTQAEPARDRFYIPTPASLERLDRLFDKYQGRL